MRTVYVGNLENDARRSDVERVFGHYGRLHRVDIKPGYAFVYFEDERDAAEAIRKLDKCPFGKEKRRLSVEWAKSEHSRPPGDGKAHSNQKPSKTLFVTNFDPVTTKQHDIENHFEPYGKINYARITRNFAFVQFATQEDATKALESTRRSKILGNVISIEYAFKYGDQYGGSPRRSLSPVHRRRPSPDYDRYKGPSAHERRKSPAAHEKRKSPAPGERRRSPAPGERRRSPAAHESRRSPAPGERRKSPAAHERRRKRRRSPAPDERRRSPAAHERRRSPAPGKRLRSPARRSPGERRKSPVYGRRSSDYDRHRSQSPVARGRR